MKHGTKLLVAALLSCGSLQAQNVVPAYAVQGKDSTCQIFVYSPGEREGLHLAFLGDDEKWHEVGQLCASDYGPWGAEKRMFDPFVTKANDGTWRAVWAVNSTSPVFAVAYSEDLVTWRPQDYPIVREKGIHQPVVYQMGDGSFDIYFKTAKGKRYVQATEDFRHFVEDSLASEADDILWQVDNAEVNGKSYKGNAFDVPAMHLNYIRSWFAALKKDAALYAERMKDDAQRFASLRKPVEAILHVDNAQTKAISNKLVGVFFEDISRAADGGLYAQLLENGDFEYTSADHKGWTAQTAWTSDKPMVIATDQPLSKNNPHYAILDQATLVNQGWDKTIYDRGGLYDFSLYARCLGPKKGQLIVQLADSMGQPLAEGKLKVEGAGWQQYSLVLNTVGKKRTHPVQPKNCSLRIISVKEGRVAVDMVSLFPHETYKGHGMRKDIAEAIAALKPKFMRFPGGCMLHGDGLENIYHWKESVGPLYNRKPDRNIWGYHQTRGLGFYEYFQFCEDIGAEPLPVLAAGVPCQNSAANAEGIAGQQGGIPMAEMPAYVQDVLDLIEWANGDVATSKWAKMRADAGHPAPFQLKMIGIGNEDLITTQFEERYLMICKAVKAKYPNIEVIGTVGPFHYPSADYIEGWKFAKAHKEVIDVVDEHYYESAGWFLHNQDYYDSYDRKAPKVYLGEYASRTRTMESALAEAVHLCNIERNGDVVEMTSYAPLLCHEKYQNWNPDMIYFNASEVKTTPSYNTQALFSQFSGDSYVASHVEIAPELAYRMAASVVKDSRSGNTYLKLVNALPVTVSLKVDGLALPAQPRMVYFSGKPGDESSQLRSSEKSGALISVQNGRLQLPAYSVVAVSLAP